MTLKTAAQNERKLIMFRLADRRCALPLESVREIVPMPMLSRPAGMPSLLEGFLNLDGAAVPVIRLNRLLNLPEREPGLYTPLIVLRTCLPSAALAQADRQAGDHPTALLVSEAMGIISTSEAACMPIQEADSFNGCIEAQITLNDSMVHLLHPGRILLEKERRAVKEFQAIAQKRIDELKQSDS